MTQELGCSTDGGLRGISQSFARRRARKLSAYREGLIEEQLPLLTLDLAQPFGGDRAFFERYRGDLRLEIGFGAGEHLLAQVVREPQTGFIGCEPYRNGVAALLAGLEKRGLEKRGLEKRGLEKRGLEKRGLEKRGLEKRGLEKRGLENRGAEDSGKKAREGGEGVSSFFPNLRLFADDALLLLPALPEGCLSFLYLLFPDPWPRRRHGKRRLLRRQVLDMLARPLRTGGILRWSTDEPVLVATGLAACCAHPCFVWRARAPDDWRLPPRSWVATRYQRKAERAGRSIFYATFERR